MSEIRNINEKALFYMCYQTKRYYKTFAVLGAVLSILVLFRGTPDYTLIFTPLVGYLFAFLDNELNFYLLIRRPNIYAKRLEWQELVRTRLGGNFLILPPKKIKLFSKEGLKLYSEHIKSFFIYESYKWLIIFFLILPAFISTKAEAKMFNWGLNIFFWAIFYLILWNKKYFWKAAKAFGIAEELSKEIRNFPKI